MAAQDTIMRSAMFAKLGSNTQKNLCGFSQIISVQLLTYYLTIMTKISQIKKSFRQQMVNAALVS